MDELTKAGGNDPEDEKNFKKLFCENYEVIDRLRKQVPEAEDLFCELRGVDEWPSDAAEMETSALPDFREEGNVEAVYVAFMSFFE